MRTGAKYIVTYPNGHYGLSCRCDGFSEVYEDRALWAVMGYLRVCGSKSEAKGFKRRAEKLFGFEMTLRNVVGLTKVPMKRK